MLAIICTNVYWGAPNLFIKLYESEVNVVVLVDADSVEMCHACFATYAVNIL